MQHIGRPIETLSSKFKPQFNETIKSLQFWMLYRKDGKNAKEWIGRLQLTAVECNYQELDRQLKEQFIHRLNDKEMLGKIIKELTTTKGNDTITSENILSRAKRVEAQRAQSAVMSTITETKEFDKIRISKYAHKDSPRRSTQSSMSSKQICRYCCSTHPPRQCLAHGNMCMECSKIGHFQKVCRSRRTRAMNEVEQKTVQVKTLNW